MATIKEAKSDDEIAQCLPVLRELRGHFKVDSSRFVERVQQQRKEGYHLVYLEDQGKIQATAGYRIRDNLETPDSRYAKHCMPLIMLPGDWFHRLSGHSHLPRHSHLSRHSQTDTCQSTKMPKHGRKVSETSSCKSLVLAYR